MAHDPSTRRPVPRPSSKSSRQQETIETHVSSPLGSTEDRRSRPGSLDLNENSPLLSPQRFHGERGFEDRDAFPGLLECTDGEEEKSKSTFYLIVLTLGIGG